MLLDDLDAYCKFGVFPRNFAISYHMAARRNGLGHPARTRGLSIEVLQEVLFNFTFMPPPDEIMLPSTPADGRTDGRTLAITFIAGGRGHARARYVTGGGPTQTREVRILFASQSLWTFLQSGLGGDIQFRRVSDPDPLFGTWATAASVLCDARRA